MKDQETLGSMTYLEKEPNILGLQNAYNTTIADNRMMIVETSGMASLRITENMEPMPSLGMVLVM
jgi:hypothetical protein